eukprot:9196946-Pyramimonas_sp.AAC.1
MVTKTIPARQTLLSLSPVRWERRRRRCDLRVKTRLEVTVFSGSCSSRFRPPRRGGEQDVPFSVRLAHCGARRGSRCVRGL